MSDVPDIDVDAMVAELREKNRLLEPAWKATMAGDLDGRQACACGVGFVNWCALLVEGKWYTDCTCHRLQIRHNRGPGGFIHQ